MAKKGGHPNWKPGESGNPAGRPKGARSKLAEAFVKDLYDSWSLYGPKVIVDVVESKPEKYLEIVAKVLPKQIEADLNVSGLEELLSRLPSGAHEPDHPALEEEPGTVRH